MNLQVSDRTDLPNLAAPVMPQLENLLGGAGSPFGAAGGPNSPTDGVKRMANIALLGPIGGTLANQTGGGLFGGGLLGGLNPLQGILQELMSLLQSLFAALQGGGGNFGGNTPGNEQYFGNANGSSWGDPHLNFTGTNANGQQLQGASTNMNGQPDLLESDSFDGGYQIATQTTTPNANGVTSNSQANISTQNGSTVVSLDNQGNANITENGTSFALQNGASYDLGNGEVATRNQDGSLIVTQTNGNGGSITTTLTDSGNGVNVSTQAQNVDLGGTLVDGATMPAPQQPQPQPQPQPLPLPQPQPQPQPPPWQRWYEPLTRISAPNASPSPSPFPRRLR